MFGQVITKTEGVASLLEFTYTVTSARELQLRFRALLDDGTIFPSGDFASFMVISDSGA